jgi:hypothetical protein
MEHANTSRGREPPNEPRLFGRHFSWMARTCVKIAQELELTDAQFIKLVAVMVQELRQTNERFNRDTFIAQVRVTAMSVKQNAGALDNL